jgi:uroporphyrinogen decarboxylase
MNKRDTLLNLIYDRVTPDTIPAAFFMHFDPIYHQGQAAIDKHLEFFNYTGMDFVKIQYEQALPSIPQVHKPADWANAPRYPAEFFDETVQVVEALVKASRRDALVIMTLYSPFMWAAHLGKGVDFASHLQENPEAVSKGLEIMTENVLTLAHACKQAGVDGFYASSQGGEVSRLGSSELFREVIKPTDLAVWSEIQSCLFNILHICDYEGEYDDLSPFLDYPGHVVNCSLKLGERRLDPKEVSQMFGRPFMGGLERKGVIATGKPTQIQQAALDVLAQAPDRFILAADCTIPGEAPWENLKIAIDAAHGVWLDA